MASRAIETRPDGLRTNLTLGSSTLQRHVRALLVSPDTEARKALLRVLESLAVDVITCSTRAQAEEVLSRRVFEIVFCDEHLPDGSYGDLIHANHCEYKIPRVAVVTRTGEWDFFFAAMSRGAFDVIRFPWHATDLEMTIIRALRAEDHPPLSRVAVG